MTKWINHAYPFLFAIIPVVRLVADNPGWVEVDDAAVILTTVLAACGVVYGLALLATRRRGGGLAPLILMAVVLAFWVYLRVALLLDRRVRLVAPDTPAAVGGRHAGHIWWLARRPALLDGAERFLTLTSGMLVAWFVLSIGVNEWRSARAVREVRLSSGWRSQSRFSRSEGRPEAGHLPDRPRRVRQRRGHWMALRVRQSRLPGFLATARLRGASGPQQLSPHLPVAAVDAQRGPRRRPFGGDRSAGRWIGPFRIIWSGTTERCLSSSRRATSRVVPLPRVGGNPARLQEADLEFDAWHGSDPAQPR